MKRQTSGKSRTFFIEFLIVLFFFLIIGTVCLRVFVSAHQVTRDADALAHAQSTAASIAEVLEAGEDIRDYFPDAVLLAGAETDAAGADDASNADNADDDSNATDESGAADAADADTANNGDNATDAVDASDMDIAENGRQSQCYQMTWDRDFTVCSGNSDSVFYTLMLQLDTTDHMQTASMVFTDSSGETLYELTVSYHLALTREEALS